MYAVASILLVFASSQAVVETSGQVTEKLQINCNNPLTFSKPDTVETSEEKAARADRDFHRALMLMDKCISKVAVGAASAGGGGSGSGADGGSGAGAGSGASASGGLEGTERSETQAQQQPQQQPQQQTQTQEPTPTVGSSGSNGPTENQVKPPPTPESGQPTTDTPPDIPGKQNDDVVARQLRELAENEKDPALRRKYWNQYRKYKGLAPIEPASKEKGTQ